MTRNSKEKEARAVNNRFRRFIRSEVGPALYLRSVEINLLSEPNRKRLFKHLRTAEVIEL